MNEKGTPIDVAPTTLTCSTKWWWITTDSRLNDRHFISGTRPDGPCLGPFESHDDLMECYNKHADALGVPECPVCQLVGPMPSKEEA